MAQSAAMKRSHLWAEIARELEHAELDMSMEAVASRFVEGRPIERSHAVLMDRLSLGKEIESAQFEAFVRRAAPFHHPQPEPQPGVPPALRHDVVGRWTSAGRYDLGCGYHLNHLEAITLNIARTDGGQLTIEVVEARVTDCIDRSCARRFESSPQLVTVRDANHFNTASLWSNWAIAVKQKKRTSGLLARMRNTSSTKSIAAAGPAGHAMASTPMRTSLLKRWRS